MKIEGGRSYINAEGDIKRLIPSTDFLYPYYCGLLSYSKQGTIILGLESPKDLICEVVPEIYETYKSGWYESYKDFLIAHYEYYSGKKYAQTNI